MNVWVRRVVEFDPDEALATLSEHERSRAAALRTRHPRSAALHDAHVAGTAWARTVLAELSGRSPDEVQLVEGAHGKPLMADAATHHGAPHHNVSHTDALVALAVDLGSPVGVDIERVEDFARRQAVMARRFSAEEQALVERHTGADAVRWFFQIWTRKEASIKAYGVNLAALRSMRTLDHGDGSWSATLAGHDAQVKGTDLCLNDFDDLGAHVGAVSRLDTT